MSNMQWIDIFGQFKEDSDGFSAVIPDIPESKWHFGPARIWSKPVHRSRYGNYLSLQVFIIVNFLSLT